MRQNGTRKRREEGKDHHPPSRLQDEHFQKRPEPTEPAANVGETERLASLIAGGMLAAFGLARGHVAGLVLAGLGSALIYRGWTGHCSVYKALDVNTSQPDKRLSEG